MRALLDTNVLIRHLRQDPPDQGAAATAFLSAAHELLLTDVVVAEVVYVLESFYRQPRARVARAIRMLLGLPGIVVSDPTLLLRAVELYEDARVDFAEAYIAAAAEHWRVGLVASFDRSLDRVGSVRRTEPT